LKKKNRTPSCKTLAVIVKKTVQLDNFGADGQFVKKLTLPFPDSFLRLADKNKSGDQQPLKKTGRH